MQTTLLGIAIAFILALLAALIGPYFIDWNRFRPQFEAEASRVIGLPVHVEGAIDARLLPTPSLRLRGVNVGARFDESNVRVEKLDVEFSLGSLLRGEWRAEELTLNGLAVDLGLDQRGRMEWASRAGMLNVGALTVDRLNVTGTLALKDAASRSLVTFNDVAFKGDIRTAAGVIRGDGSFVAMGTQYPFRLSTGHPADGSGLRLRIGIDPAARPFAAELDGLLTFEDAVPRFDGTVSVARPVPAKPVAPDAEPPWKIAAKLKADPSSARFEQVEATYGFDEASLKLAGSGDLRLGDKPLLHAVLSAKQLDADRLLARKDMPVRPPLDLVKSLGGSLAAVPVPPIPAQLEIASELIVLGGRPVQNIRADLRSDGRDWLIDRFEARAPGATVVTLSGHFSTLNDAPDFSGPVTISIGDPDILATWLQGSTDAPYRAQKPVQAQGTVSIAKDRLMVEALKAEIDGRAVEGSFTLTTTEGASKLDASLKADAIDLTWLSLFVPNAGGAVPALWPKEMRLALDLASVRAFGQTFSPVRLQMDYGAKGIAIERLRIGNADSVVVEGNGAFDLASASGQINLSTASSSLDQIGRLIAPLHPKLGQRIAALPTGAGNVWLGLVLGLDKPKDDRADLRATLDLDSPALKGTLTAKTSASLAALGALDPQALTQTPLSVSGKLNAGQATALFAALGLEGVLAPASAPAAFELSAKGSWQKPLALKASLLGRDIDASVDGTVGPLTGQPAASVNLVIRKANIAPLAGLNNTAIAAALTARLALADGKANFTGLEATIGGAHLRGRLGVKLEEPAVLDGELGVDAIDIPGLLAVAIGASEPVRSEPLGKGLLRGWRGRIAFQALRAALLGTEIRPFGGVVEADGSAVTLQASADNVADGKGKVELAAKRDDDGVALTTHLQLTGADGARLRYRTLAMPAGKVSTDLTIGASGRSLAALIGSMAGSGAVTLEQGVIAGFDAKVFQAAIDASDASQFKDQVKDHPRDEARLAALLEPMLAKGRLGVGTAEFPVTIKDGQLRVAATPLNGDGARLTLSGGYDMPADQLDLRAVLAPTAASYGSNRPELRVSLVGTPDALSRSLDVSALSSWLTLRAIDRETKRLEAIERSAPSAIPPPPAQTTPPQHSPPQPQQSVLPQPSQSSPQQSSPQSASGPAVDPQAAVPPLPPPIEVRPVPGAARPSAPKARPPLQLTPGTQ